METMMPVEEKIEVTLASPMRRIAAAVINNILNLVVVVMSILGVILLRTVMHTAWDPEEGINNIDILLVSGIYVIYGLVQIYLMSRDGQSLGKKIMKIRVLKLDGSNPGFWGTVVIREIAWSILLMMVTMVMVLMYGMFQEKFVIDFLTDMIWLGTFLANVVMLFVVKNDRRTLYDYLAGTVVVALPERQ